ncbi:MAG: ferrochelatase [Gammaproteobacteria bacterium]
MSNKAVLLLNLGTPSAPTAAGLRKFYKYFFADPFVFDMNPLGRWMLRNLIIQPFRAPRTAKDYASIWMDGGSPLKVYADRLQASVQKSFTDAGENVQVLNGMAYSEPFIGDSMAELERQNIEDILVLPLFPQYSTATTASVFHAVEKAAARFSYRPKLHFVTDLFAESAFIRAWAIVITRHLDVADVQHLVFSYHGLPERTIKKADEHGTCRFGVCCHRITDANRLCYRAQCFATTESIISALGWKDVSHSMAFQSRFGREPWTRPYLDEHLRELVKQGIRKVAVITPSFISDCLETLHEIGIEYREQFMDVGGEVFQLMPNLNDDPAWFSAVYEIARDKLATQPQREVEPA